RFHAIVHMLTVVAIRPTVEGAVAHRGKIVRYQVAAQFVALVHDCPQQLAHGLPRKTVWIAQPRRKNAVRTTASVHLPDRGSSLLHLHATLGDIAVRAHRHIESGSVSAGDQILGPVVIDRTSW